MVIIISFFTNNAWMYVWFSIVKLFFFNFVNFFIISLNS